MKDREYELRSAALKEPDERQRSALRYLRPFVRQSGDSIRKPWYISDRCLFDYLLVYIESGYGVFSLDKDIFQIKQGGIFWVPPGIRHSMRGTSPEMRCLYIHFDLCYDPDRSHWNAVVPGGMSDLAPWKERMHPVPEDPDLSALRGLLDFHGNRAEFSGLLKKLCREHLRCDGHPPRLSAMVIELVDMLLSDRHQTGQGAHHRSINEAASFIRQNSSEIKSIAELAAAFGFSPSHFRLLFKRQHGMSPAEMLQQSRLQKACELLAYSSFNIGEIAERCGFGNIYNFSRAFKAEMGLSPKQYRQ